MRKCVVGTQMVHQPTKRRPLGPVCAYAGISWVGNSGCMCSIVGASVTNHDVCVTCHTRHTSVTDFRPKSGNPMEVTLVTSPKLYIVSHTKGTTSLGFNINHDTPVNISSV